jgi:Transcriptional regulators
MADIIELPLLPAVGRPTVADQVFAELRRQILSLELPPGTRLSEVEVARQMGVSRQPVRDAFYRLSKLGFLLIRPQRATTVSLISPKAVFQARFIRTAIEIETARAACASLTARDIDALARILEDQEVAVARADKGLFHELDDRFHKEICTRSGHGFAWDLILENKAHMDRVRMLSLSFALHVAYQDHLEMLAALTERDEARAITAVRDHLSRILGQIARIHADNRDLFAEEDA